MIFDRKDAIFVFGQADTGKTVWSKIHMWSVPQEYRWVLDYNFRDLREFEGHAYRYHGMTTGMVPEAQKFMKELYNHGHAFALFDEVDNYFTRKNTFLTQFITTAKNRGVGFIAIGKRTKAVPPEVRGRFNKIACFGDALDEDIEYLADWTGFSYEELEFIKTLGTPHYEGQPENEYKGEHVIIDPRRHTKSRIIRYDIQQ